MSTSNAIRITVNGQLRAVPGGLTVTGLLGLLELHPAQVAVEHNREILKRDLWRTTAVRDGDQLEIVHFVGGG